MKKLSTTFKTDHNNIVLNLTGNAKMHFYCELLCLLWLIYY